MLANVQQRTIKPVITAAVAPGPLVHTDEYAIYARLPAWGYGHETVCHGRGEYARDEDGVCEVHVNTLEGFWSLLRSWLRPHRGISQDRLPLYLGFFQLDAARRFYAGRAFVRVTDKPPQTKWATGSNLAFVSYAADPERNLVIAMGVVDNLGKGAAGQAVQNANLICGLPETAGLDGVPVWP